MDIAVATVLANIANNNLAKEGIQIHGYRFSARQIMSIQLP